MKELLLTLLSLSLSGSLLGVILLAARRLAGGRLPKAFWYYAWLLVLLRLAIPLGFGIRLPQRPQPLPEATQQTALPTAPSQSGQEAPAAGGHTPELFPAEPEPTPEVPDSALSIPGLLVSLWLAGAAGGLIWHAAAYAAFSRRVRASLAPPRPEELAVLEGLHNRRRVRLAVSDQVDTPMLTGLLRPVIVLPQNEPPLSRQALSAVLRHELTHYRRGDVCFKWLVVLAAALHWFNPLVHWFAKKIALDCELSCDEAVLAALPPEERMDYGDMLLALAARRRLPAGVTATTLCEEKRQLKARLQGILSYQKPTRTAYCLTLALSLLLACCACGVLDLAGAAAPPPAPASPNPEAAEVSLPCLPFASSGIKDVLLGSASFLYWAEGAEAPESKAISQVPGLFSPGSDYAAVCQFAVLDLDGDGRSEVVLQISDVASDMGGYLVLRQAGGTVYGYPSHWRTFWYLKTDGTFFYSYPAGNEEGSAVVRFTETGMELDKRVCGQGSQFEFDTFLLNGQPVSEAEYEAAWEAQAQKPDAEWHAFTEESIRLIF